MELLGCMDLSTCDRNITLDLTKVSTYCHNSTYQCAWITKDTSLAFSFSLREAKAIALELEACDVLTGQTLDTRFDVLVNGTRVLSEVCEDNWSFHAVYCNVPANVIKAGENKVQVRLSDSSTTSLFLKSVSVRTVGGREDEEILSLLEPHPEKGFSLAKTSGVKYRNDLQSYSIYGTNGYMEFGLRLNGAADLQLGLELCGGLVGSVIDCPIDISVNGKVIESRFDKTDPAFREYLFPVKKDVLNAGLNSLKIKLDKAAKTCVFLRKIRVGTEQTITLLTTNDIHGRFMGEGIDFAKLAAYKRQLQENGLPCLLVDSGDPTQGTPFATMESGRRAIELMNAAGYDVLTVGNHEFDNNTTDARNPNNELAENIKAFNGSFICQNLKYDGRNYIQTLLDEEGRYCIRRLGNYNILFIGFTTPGVSMEIPTMNGYGIDDVQSAGKAASALVSELRAAQKIHAVVAVSHLGSKEKNADYKTLAASFPQADVILDGHSHEKYTEKVQVSVGGTQKYIKVIQSNCYATNYGVVNLKFRFGEINDIAMDIKPCDEVNKMDFTQSETYRSVKAFISNEREELDREFGTVRASSAEHTLWGGALDEEKPYPALRAVNIARYVQTNLGVLAAEAMIADACAQSDIKKLSGMYIIGGINGGAVRESVKCGGRVRDYELYSALPSQKESETSAGYSVFEISLSVLKQVLENSVSKIEVAAAKNKDVLIAGGGVFLNSAGIKFTVVKNGTKLSIGDEITLYRRADGAGGENTLHFGKDQDTKILICLTKYLANGGDGYTMMSKEKKLYSCNRAMYLIAGQYIQSLSAGKALQYPAVKEDITYEGFAFAGEEDIRILVKSNGAPLKNCTLPYVFYTAKGKAEVKDGFTDGNGVITLTRPSGASVLRLYGPDGVYEELFMHSYFEVNKQTGMVLEFNT